MTVLEKLLFALGWDGGTIHQVSEFTGCNPLSLLYGKAEFVFTGSDHYSGACAVMTCSLEFNHAVNYPKHKGNIDFWLGVIDGVGTMEKLDHIRPALANRVIRSFK